MSRSHRFLTTKASTVGAVAAVVLSASVAAPASADFRSSFKKGIQAAEQERWDEVAAAMKEALQDRPAAQKTRVPIYGSKTVVYIPNTMLGIALAKSDRCAEAWSYFQAAEAQGIAQTHDKDRFGTMLSEKNACKDSLVKKNLAEANPLIQEAQGIRDAIDEMLKQPDGRKTFDSRSNFSVGRENGVQALIGAEQRVQLGVSNGNFTAIAESVGYARTAIAELNAVRRDLNVAIKTGIAGELSTAQNAVKAAEAEAQRTASKKQGAGSAWSRDFQTAESQAMSSLNQAKTELAAGRSANDKTKLNNAVRLASTAQAGFKKLNDREIRTAELERPKPADVQGPTSAQVRSADRALAGARQAQEDLESSRAVWSGIREVTTKVDELDRELAQVRREIERAKREKDSPSLVAATRSAERLSTRLRDTKVQGQRLAEAEAPDSPQGTPTPSNPGPDTGVPARLASAAQFYFEGDYQAALEQLESGSFAGKAQGQALLFQAAANFALYQISGGTESELRSAAAEALTKLKQTGDTASPLPRFFPPPFLEFVASNG